MYDIYAVLEVWLFFKKKKVFFSHHFLGLSSYFAVLENSKAEPGQTCTGKYNSEAVFFRLNLSFLLWSILWNPEMHWNKEVSFSLEPWNTKSQTKYCSVMLILSSS